MHNNNVLSLVIPDSMLTLNPQQCTTIQNNTPGSYVISVNGEETKVGRSTNYSGEKVLDVHGTENVETIQVIGVCYGGGRMVEIMKTRLVIIGVVALSIFGMSSAFAELEMLVSPVNPRYADTDEPIGTLIVRDIHNNLVWESAKDPIVGLDFEEGTAYHITAKKLFTVPLCATSRIRISRNQTDIQIS